MIKKLQIFIIVLLSVFGFIAITAEQEENNKKDNIQTDKVQVQTQTQTQAKATGPAALYSEPIMKCLEARRSLERTCYQKEGESQQIGCILAASKEMGLCFADYGATNFQKNALEGASELAIIMQNTSKQLQNWVENNYDSVNSFQKKASPFMEELFNNDSETGSHNGQEVLKMLELFGNLFSGNQADNQDSSGNNK